jgi:hypothetical protein
VQYNRKKLNSSSPNVANKDGGLFSTINVYLRHSVALTTWALIDGTLTLHQMAKDGFREHQRSNL